MRTTITLDPDVVAELDRLRRENGMGPSEAVNFLVRQGIRPRQPKPRITTRPANLGVKIDVANIGEVLDLLDQYDAEDASRESPRSEQHG